MFDMGPCNRFRHVHAAHGICNSQRNKLIYSFMRDERMQAILLAQPQHVSVCQTQPPPAILVVWLIPHHTAD